jgi:hypothetical protein
LGDKMLYLLSLLALAGGGDHFDVALNEGQRSYASIKAGAELLTQLRSVDCEAIASIDLGMMAASSSKRTDGRPDRNVTGRIGTMTFVRCVNGDRFALRFPEMAELRDGASVLRAGGEMRMSGTAIEGRPSGYAEPKRQDGSRFHQLGWQKPDGAQVIALLYDAETPEAGKQAIERIVGRLAPVIR